MNDSTAGGNAYGGSADMPRTMDQTCTTTADHLSYGCALPHRKDVVRAVSSPRGAADLHSANVWRPAMLTGSCLCGAVAYQADAIIERIVHCHCQTCRKAH